MGLRLWRSGPHSNKKPGDLKLDKDPQGGEELGTIFTHPLDSPEDLDASERRQDMSERILYADRAFFITMIWVGFLILLPLLQLRMVSCGRPGLSDPAFIGVLTTTTASILGFWHLVGSYLFEPKSKAGSSVDKNRSLT